MSEVPLLLFLGNILSKLIVAHINISSLRSKFDFLVEQIKGNIYLLMVSETKLDESLPTRSIQN